VPTDRDEREHPDALSDAWWWWAWTPDRTTGLFIGLEVRGPRFDYRAGLVRAGQPVVYVEELGGTGRRAGLELKPPEMWADHVCDVPLRQWSLGNEAHGVLLDHPAEMLTRPYGTPVPVTFDVEWHATAAAVEVPHGYEQVGEVDAEVQLSEGIVRLVGTAHRLHVWGTAPTAHDVLARAGFVPPTVGA